MEAKNTTRFTKLDGLRGLLSLIVALNHSFLVVSIPSFANVWKQNPLLFNSPQSKIQQLLMVLGNGGAAVTLFFLLSGLVLGPSLAKVKFNFRGLMSFLIKRLIRLYPVYILIVILTAIYMNTIFVHQTFPASSPWFNWWMNFQMTAKEFVLNLMLVNTYTGGVTWTLRVIVIASILFPVFFLLNNKTSWWIDICITLLLIYLSFTVFKIDNFRDLRYLYMFYLGLSIPKFKSFFIGIPNWTVHVLAPLMIVLFLSFRYLTNEYTGGVVEAIISFFIIGISAFSQKVTIFNFLDGKVFKFFGKISYSLYLIHFSVLYLISKAMFVNFPNLPYKDSYLIIHISLFVISTIVATAVSYLVYRLVEVPSQVLSGKVSSRVSH